MLPFFADHHGPINVRLSSPTPTFFGMKWAVEIIGGSTYILVLLYCRMKPADNNVYSGGVPGIYQVFFVRRYETKIFF